MFLIVSTTQKRVTDIDGNETAKWLVAIDGQIVSVSSEVPSVEEIGRMVLLYEEAIGPKRAIDRKK